MAKKSGTLKPTHEMKGSLRSETGKAKGVRVYVGDCRDVLGEIPQVKRGEVDLVFADPPFNWSRAYDEWHDSVLVVKEGEQPSQAVQALRLCCLPACWPSGGRSPPVRRVGFHKIRGVGAGPQPQHSADC